jgi:hypothetical protein
MPTGLKRNSYVRRRGNIKVDTTDETHRLSALLEAAIDAWNLDSGRARRKRPEPKFFHRQHQAPIRESLGELLARADRPPAPPLDCEGWQDWILDGESPSPKPALE